jgi:DNA-binding MurR/RpiR family transcriptional regulator
VSATRIAPTLDERIAASRAVLSPAEERVAAFLADHREEAVFLSAAEIARRLDSSDATVIRAVQSLGYGGLPALKAELQEALRPRATATLRLGRSLEELGGDPAVILEHVLAAEQELLADARRTLRAGDFARAIELIARADRVLVQGVGPNASLADYFALRLNRLRKPAVAITARGLGLADGLLQMRQGDVVISIAYERGTPEFEHVLDRAKELRLPSILITDTLGLALADRVTVALSARRAGGGQFHLSAITIVVIDALLLGLAGRDRVEALDAYQELQEMRARIEPH